jgi:hypothetical protein
MGQWVIAFIHAHPGKKPTKSKKVNKMISEEAGLEDQAETN